MKPSIPKGTRDFSPKEMQRRNYIFSSIKTVFERYGYNCIETPSFENLSTLTGKYGDEGDRLIFKILNSGNYLDEANKQGLSTNDTPQKFTQAISEKALRYDLTVPFARYVVMNRNTITFPFKRYQIQPVWRADRPQKSRYREFYQCDADVIGSNSLINEAELIKIYDDVFGSLNLKNIEIKLNNRKVLVGIAEVIGQPDKLIDITTAIDKLDKIGLDNVCNELTEKGITPNAIEALKPLLNFKHTSNANTIEFLKQLLNTSETGKEGIKELETVLNYFNKDESILFTLNHVDIVIDIALARGLNYYTGCIIEVKHKTESMGSLGGGGRYDNLTGIFGLPNISGVGISFGADRIYDIMEQLNLFNDTNLITTEVLFTNLGTKEEAYALPLLQALREAKVNAEIYPDTSKLKKQLDYANAKGIPRVIIIGENEIEQGKVTYKDMITGEQESLLFSDILSNYKIDAF
jgi:histidyl-tRNA synthetase